MPVVWPAPTDAGPEPATFRFAARPVVSQELAIAVAGAQKRRWSKPRKQAALRSSAPPLRPTRAPARQDARKTGSVAAGSGWPDQSRCYLIGHSTFPATKDQGLTRSFMRSWYSGTLGVFLVICVTLPADAQDSSRFGEPTPNSATSPATLTGKERLGRKWMDEQRIDNCKVPIDKRGSRPRPSVCPHVPTG
jgi:hypothetical protein